MSISELHTKAMDMAEKAFIAGKKSEKRKALELTKASYELERKAALMLENDIEQEPTRSVLFKSAACLAIDLENFTEAKDLVNKALNGNPPHVIYDELNELLTEINIEISKRYRNYV